MKVIILAAGLGSRLGELGKNLPKGMITIFGKTLIERQIEIFHNCGINDITIITGHNSEVIKYTNVDYIKNPNYATTNMNESLFCAKQKFDDSILVSYADIIFEQRTIEQILRFRQDVGVAINLDWKKNYKNRTQHSLSEAENVLIENYKVVRLRKNITECLPNQKIGEFLGIIKLSKKGAMYFLEKYLKLKNSHKGVFHSSPSFQKAYLTDMLQEIVDSKMIVYPIVTKGLWMEIDTAEDLKRAENLLKI